MDHPPGGWSAKFASRDALPRGCCWPVWPGLLWPGAAVDSGGDQHTQVACPRQECSCSGPSVPSCFGSVLPITFIALGVDVGLKSGVFVLRGLTARLIVCVRRSKIELSLHGSKRNMRLCASCYFQGCYVMLERMGPYPSGQLAWLEFMRLLALARWHGPWLSVTNS